MTAPRRAVVALVVSTALVVSAALVPALPVAAQDDGPTTTMVPVPRLATPVLSPRRVPELLVSGVAAQRVEQASAEIMDLAPETSCLVVADGGRVLYRHGGDRPLAPASTQKLLTAVALVDRFGPDHRQATTVLAERRPDGDGVVDGDLYLVGGGDPLLLTGGYRPTMQDRDRRITSDFAALADALADAGVREVRGDVVGDDGRYDRVRYVESWPRRYQRQDTVGPLSALTVNDGVTGYTEAPDEPTGVRQPGDPPLLAAQTFLTLLEDRDIEVDGEARSGDAPDGADELARHESPPLTDLLAEILGWSDNYAAELQVKELGLEASGEGSTASGLAEVRRLLEARGLPLDGVVLNDGSGLDEGNRATCDLLVALLAQEQERPQSVVLDQLSVAGESGTLFQRLGGSPAEGRVRAKTGTLNQVLSLAGLIDTVPGDRLTFAFIVNIPPEGDPDATTALQDRLVEALVTYPDAPDPTALGPLPPA